VNISDRKSDLAEAQAEGATITDIDGLEYLDFSSGQMCLLRSRGLAG
jgi:4-aminobutyrate aminotransferase-like enzyme